MVAITARVNIDPALRQIEGLRRFPRIYGDNLRRFGDQVAEREASHLRAVAQVDSGAQRASIGWERDQSRRFVLGQVVQIRWRVGFGVQTPLPRNQSGRTYYEYTRAPVQQQLAGLRFRRGMQAAADAARTKALSELRRVVGG